MLSGLMYLVMLMSMPCFMAGRCLTKPPTDPDGIGWMEAAELLKKKERGGPDDYTLLINRGKRSGATKFSVNMQEAALDRESAFKFSDLDLGMNRNEIEVNN
ncbi:unnamed protein product [Microthlaspi erraticum]|uniref:Uncharacterized protein n=1 Tax=Microthlaspi erraticum TaxID=1685480 RepID=A0A6D2HPW3_9BRAS|nr:unnamed protein product [Microthlaspi erraticum]